MNTDTKEIQSRLSSYLNRDGYVIPDHLGNKENACSLGAINLAIDGEVRDYIPYPMSYVIGEYIRCIQDRIPERMRNSKEWKENLIEYVGTRHDDAKVERKRFVMIQDWFWDVVLASLQETAEKLGYGNEWRMMREERDYTTEESLTEDRLSGCRLFDEKDPDYYHYDNIPMRSVYRYTKDVVNIPYQGRYNMIAIASAVFYTRYIDPKILDVIDPVSLLHKLTNVHV